MANNKLIQNTYSDNEEYQKSMKEYFKQVTKMIDAMTVKDFETISATELIVEGDLAIPIGSDKIVINPKG